MDYQLELKQIVEFPRCRIYREFIQTMITDKSIRTSGGSFLFYYLVLCSYANYRTSYRRMEHLVYTVGPGEWICPLKELQSWFRCKFQHQAISILNTFEERGYISYTVMEKNKIVKFKINDWPNNNKILEYNYPCKKDAGFFFFPIAKVHELIGMGKCSEMDILLDLWIHAVYNDTSVMGSDSGPVVYYRNNTGNPLTSFQTLANRWSQSKASVARVLRKLEDKKLITLISFKGKYGSMIYLNSYLSVMFDVSDVMIDKEEIAMKMQLPIHIPEESGETFVSELVTEDQITVSESDSCVPDSHMKIIVEKVAELLNTQGVPCCRCQKSQYILSPLSAWNGLFTTYTLNIICPFGNTSYRFELSISLEDTIVFPDPFEADAPVKEGGEGYGTQRQ
ncbi:MAG: MarR family transcriptional regulator [Eubacteriales bacterium]|nr:MarR family transcriptional regulator [Eubacteriales bacterium]